MKKRIFSFLLSMILCLSLVPAVLAAEAESAGGFDASVTVDRKTEGRIYVTVNADGDILAEKQPTLSVPCAFTYARVIDPEENVLEAQAEVSDGMISFTVAKTGMYTVEQLFTVTLVANDGSGMSPQLVCGIDGELNSLPTPTREGYSFKDWFDAAEGGNEVTTNTVFTADATIYAQWTVNQYSITFDSNGGSAVAAITQDYGTEINAPADPTRRNYDFLGWDKEIPATMPAENMTITARWQYDPPYVPVVPSKPITSTETTKNEDGSTTTTVTNNKTGTVTETTENVDGSTVTVETKRDGTVTEITERADGSTTTVETKADGTLTETVENTDGSTVTTQTNADGSSSATTALADGTAATIVTDVTGETKTEVTVSDTAVETAAETGEAVTLPIPALETTADRKAAPVITVITGSEESVAVKIPVAKVSVSTVAVIVNEDGTETIVTETKMTENGLVVDVPDGATVKIVDNSIDFNDVEDKDWEKDAVNFASARGLVNGVDNNRFDPDSTATRAQVVTLLARLAGVDTTPGEGELWCDKGHEWAVANGITYEGNLNAIVSRQSVFTMLWLMNGAPKSDYDISHFTDSDGLTKYTEPAARWAAEIGLLQGYGNGIMDPNGSVTRGQLAQFMMNFIQMT